MGFETLYSNDLVFKYYIWTISLWDLKPAFKCEKLRKIIDLNYFPMGFETFGMSNILLTPQIWTISLWDLKHRQTYRHITEVFIWTISLWDLKLSTWCRIKLQALNLNYFPMGFETMKQSIPMSWNFIWTISLWDLKRFMETVKNEAPSIWTISLWDLKLKGTESAVNVANIWTISLWDLKPKNAQCKTSWDKFELFPYGIWNPI